MGPRAAGPAARRRVVVDRVEPARRRDGAPTGPGDRACRIAVRDADRRLRAGPGVAGFEACSAAVPVGAADRGCSSSMRRRRSGSPTWSSASCGSRLSGRSGRASARRRRRSASSSARYRRRRRLGRVRARRPVPSRSSTRRLVGAERVARAGAPRRGRRRAGRAPRPVRLGPGQPHGEGGARDGDVRRLREGGWPVAGRAPRRRPRPGRLRCLGRHRRDHRRPDRAGRRLRRAGLPAGEAEDRAGRGTSRRSPPRPRRLPGHAAHRRRERGVRAWTTSGCSSSSTPWTC